MVEPVSMTVGVLAAAMLAKAAERTGEQAADAGAGALTRFVGWLRGRVAGKPAQALALEKVAEVPDSPSRVRALADALDALAESEPAFAQELRARIEQAKSGGVEVRSIAQNAVGDHIVQVADSQGSVSVNCGLPVRPVAD